MMLKGINFPNSLFMSLDWKHQKHYEAQSLTNQTSNDEIRNKIKQTKKYN
jgi:hypothetical protein